MLRFYTSIQNAFDINPKVLKHSLIGILYVQLIKCIYFQQDFLKSSKENPGETLLLVSSAMVSSFL